MSKSLVPLLFSQGFEGDPVTILQIWGSRNTGDIAVRCRARSELRSSDTRRQAADDGQTVGRVVSTRPPSSHQPSPEAQASLSLSSVQSARFLRDGGLGLARIHLVLNSGLGANVHTTCAYFFHLPARAPTCFLPFTLRTFCRWS